MTSPPWADDSAAQMLMLIEFLKNNTRPSPMQGVHPARVEAAGGVIDRVGRRALAPAARRIQQIRVAASGAPGHVGVGRIGRNVSHERAAVLIVVIDIAPIVGLRGARVDAEDHLGHQERIARPVGDVLKWPGDVAAERSTQERYRPPRRRRPGGRGRSCTERTDSPKTS